jgi:hypothetical protein
MKFWDFGYRPRYYVRHPFKFVKSFCCSLKYAWQRLLRGWDERASWDITDYLGDLIPQLARDLIRYGHGAPVSMFDGSPFEEHSRVEKDEAKRKWDDILEEIASGFEAARRIGDPPQWYIAEKSKELGLGSSCSYKSISYQVRELAAVMPYWDNEQRKKFHHGMYLFHRYYFDLWD